MEIYRGSGMAPSQPSLRANRALVVQLRAPPPRTSTAYDAQGEHVLLGLVARFQSMQELPVFMIRELTEVQASSDSP